MIAGPFIPLMTLRSAASAIPSALVPMRAPAVELPN